MPRWQSFFAAAIFQLLGSIASGQDRPLLQPLKIAYVQHEGAADHLRHSQTLEKSLRRRGSQPYWQGFDNGLAAIRALDAGEVDIVLDASLDDVFVSKQANLAMVFIAELLSSSFCCSLEHALADQIDIRYTLSSAHLAHYREDILLILYQSRTEGSAAPSSLDNFCRSDSGRAEPATHFVELRQLGLTRFDAEGSKSSTAVTHGDDRYHR